jgi:hypothetical protein
LGPLGTAAINRPIVPAPGDYDGENGGMIGRGNRITRRKPAPVPLCPPHTPHAARMSIIHHTENSDWFINTIVIMFCIAQRGSSEVATKVVRNIENVDNWIKFLSMKKHYYNITMMIKTEQYLKQAKHEKLINLITN